MWMMFGCWTEDMIWISLRIRMRSASVSILLFLIVLIATCRKILSRLTSLLQTLMRKLRQRVCVLMTVQSKRGDLRVIILSFLWLILRGNTNRYNDFWLMLSRPVLHRQDSYEKWKIKSLEKSSTFPPLVTPFVCYREAVERLMDKESVVEIIQRHI